MEDKKPPKPPKPPEEDKILEELVDIYNRIVFEDNTLPYDNDDHIIMLKTCNILIELRYGYVFKHQDPIGSIDFKEKES